MGSAFPAVFVVRQTEGKQRHNAGTAERVLVGFNIEIHRESNRLCTIGVTCNDLKPYFLKKGRYRC